MCNKLHIATLHTGCVACCKPTRIQHRLLGILCGLLFQVTMGKTVSYLYNVPAGSELILYLACVNKDDVVVSGLRVQVSLSANWCKNPSTADLIKTRPIMSLPKLKARSFGDVVCATACLLASQYTSSPRQGTYTEKGAHLSKGCLSSANQKASMCDCNSQ